jgi:hypothetical protein
MVTGAGQSRNPVFVITDGIFQSGTAQKPLHVRSRIKMTVSGILIDQILYISAVTTAAGQLFSALKDHYILSAVHWN